MKIFFAGTPETAIPTLSALLEAGHEIVGVITRDDAPVGRKAILTPSPVAVFAQSAGIETIKANRITDDVCERIEATHADLGIVVAYGGFLSDRALQATTFGWLNLHFSDLPQLRGAAPVQHTLLQGNDKAATCVFQLVAAMDAGPIASTEFTDLNGTETTGELLATLALTGAHHVVDVVENVSQGTMSFTEQVGEPTFAPKLDAHHGQLIAEDSGQVNFNRYRGVTPEPGAWILDNGVRVKIHVAKLSIHALEPGEICIVDDSVLWGTASTAIELVEVQPSGKQRMNARDWARGRR